MSRLTNILMGIIGTGLMMLFVLGLTHSISTGFAGVLGRFASFVYCDLRDCPCAV